MKRSIIALIIGILVVLGIFIFTNNATAPTVPIDMASSTPPVPTDTTSPNQLPLTTTLRLDQEITVDDLKIKPTAVLEDSRCPKDVQCIWAGKVRVAFSVSGSTSSVFELGQTIIFKDKQIKLDEVTPHPISTSKIADDEYRFKINVSEANI